MKTFLDTVLDTLNRKHLAIILRSLLDRYPIIVSSDIPESADMIAETLVKLIPHRREVVFGSDFISHSEHERMVEHERSDYNGERMIYRSPSSSMNLLSKEISNFQGWVIVTNPFTYDQIRSALMSNPLLPVVLRYKGGILELEPNGGTKIISNTSFEEKLLEKVTTETRRKMERITRILRRAAKGKVSKRLEKSLIDLNQEEERVRQSLYREHIQGFVEAAWRVLIILMRLRLLQGVGVRSSISDKMLRQAIDYKGASIERLMEFIKSEWGEDFQSSVQEGTGQTVGDRLEGFWTI